MKYNKLNLGHIEAIVNKLGGMEGVKALLRGSMVVTIVKHVVNLAANPRLPADGFEVVKHIDAINGKKEVEIELRSDDNLYADSCKVILTQSKRQVDGKIVEGHELRKELENGEQVLLNSNILDYIYDHPELFPEHWKKDENGNTRYIYFWGSIFRSPSYGRLFVRRLSWDDGELNQGYDWLDGGWNDRLWSASLASI